MVVREVGAGNRGEVVLGPSRTADRTSEIRSGEPSSKRRKCDEDISGLKSIARSMTGPVSINILTGKEGDQASVSMSHEKQVAETDAYLICLEHGLGAELRLAYDPVDEEYI